MAIVQVERLLCFTLHMLIVVSYLQLLTITEAKPLPVTGHPEVAVNETGCKCNRTNLTMMINEQFLYNWMKFNGHHSVRHLTEAAGDLVDDTNHLQVSKYFASYSYISQ